MYRWGGRIAVVLALGVVALALLLPVGSLFVRSFIRLEVETRDGHVFRPVGDVIVREDPREDVDVADRKDFVLFSLKEDADSSRNSKTLNLKDVAEIRSVFSLEHYAAILSDTHTFGLVRNSLVLATGAALIALLMGLPLAWVLARTDLPGRHLLAALCIGPAILPPFFVAMGGARAIGRVLETLFGLSGGGLQLVNAMVVFGCVFFPLVVLLVGRALSAVPSGAYEAARLLGGRGAAWRRVVLPAVLPACVGACVLVFVLAWSDFAVPDLLGFMLPASSTPVHVFPTEVLLQWKQGGNEGRAVATGAPIVLVTVALLVLALVLLRRSPVVAGGEGQRGRPLLHLKPAGRLLGWLLVGGMLVFAFVLPMVGVARWGAGAGESVAQADARDVERSQRTRLFDFQATLDGTTGLREDRDRWIKTALAAAIVAMVVSVILARWALRGGRVARAVVLLLGALPLAVPGLVVTVGTLTLWNQLDVRWVDLGITRSVLALLARFLPFALLASWLALREVRPGHEEAAAALGGGALTRAARVWGPLAGPGIVGGALVVLILALREIDAVMLLETRILPMRLYDKVHFSRYGDEANLAFLYVGIVLIPAALAGVVYGIRRRGKGTGKA